MSSKTVVNAGSLGTFAGVFTPSILTILGIILFLRLGYVLGSGGLVLTLVILILANGISILTSLSLSAIVTNLKVKGGGDYYLISRTLGPEFGGAIGIVLFLAQSVSIAFYCLGFGEIMQSLLATHIQIDDQLIAAIAVAVLFVFAWLGTDWATRFQYVVMTILVAALLSFFIGAGRQFEFSQLQENWSFLPLKDIDFWFLFALFFPAVTGFTQGVSMSGELKTPGKSLPLGTFLAVFTSIVIYIAATIFFAGSMDHQQLTIDYTAMNKIAVMPELIIAGVFAATLSSAMASFLGAPRILQSLAADKLFKFLIPFAYKDAKTGNPRRGVLLATAIAFATIALGQLNLIAPVVSMFFLISYGLINYATFFEAQINSPSFRPRFRYYHKNLSLLGAVACLGTMLAIDIASGLIAISVLFAIYQYLQRTAPQARWADGRRSYHIKQLRTHLYAASMEMEHPRDWRPNLLLFSDDKLRRKQLLEFSSWLEGSSGFSTVVKIIEGQGIKSVVQRNEEETELQAEIKQEGSQAFALVMAAPDLDIAIHTLVQGFGIGPLRVNMILLNWIENLPTRRNPETKELNYGRHLKTAFRLGCNLVLLDSKDDSWAALQATPDERRRIDVWWLGDSSSRLMLLLAYLMTRTEQWNEASIRLLGTCHEEEVEDKNQELIEILEEVRIPAKVEVVVDANPVKVAEYSSDASLVWLPFKLRHNRPCGPFGGSLDVILPPLPTVAMVLAAKDIELDAEPESGKVAEIAEALDKITDAEKLKELTEKQAREASQSLEQKREELKQWLKKEQATRQAVDKLNQELASLEKFSTKQNRRALRAKTKLMDAIVDAKELDALDEEELLEIQKNHSSESNFENGVNLHSKPEVIEQIKRT